MTQQPPGGSGVPSAVSVPSPPPAIPGYRPVALLGSGGMASVWMAAREATGDWCALKVTHPYVADQASVQGRFEREAEVASRLRHRNIAGVHRAGVVGRQLYLDMELVGGVSLAGLYARLQEHEMPHGLVWRVNDAVLQGLAYAHDRVGPDGQPLNIVHRDLSPSNVLVGFDGVARIIDFGMVRATVGAFQTQLGQIGGTPRYMSPEQVRGRPVDRRSDLYGWAVVLVEMLTGHRLVTEGNLRMTLRSVLDDPAPRLSSLNRQIPKAVDRVVAAMLEKDPDDRPDSASDALKSFDLAIARQMWPEAEVADLVRRLFADRVDAFERLKTHSAATSELSEVDLMTAPTVIRTVPSTESTVESEANDC